MLIYHYWPDAVGGAEQACRRLAAGLADRRFECIVLTARVRLDMPRIQTDGEVRVRRFLVPEALVRVIRKPIASSTNSAVQSFSLSGKKRDEKPFISRYFSRFLRWLNAVFFLVGVTAWCCRHRQSVKVLHVHTSDWIAGLAGWLSHRLGIVALCKESTFPSLPKFQPGTPFRKRLDNFRRRLPFIALNVEIRDDLVKKSIPHERIAVIPNPIPVSRVERCESPYPLVLWIGNASQGVQTKGLDILARAWVDIKRECPDARLALLGAGVNGVVKALFEAPQGNGVQFVGYVQDVDSWIKRAWVSVLPSRREGMSNALLESMAGGVAVVASDIPGNSSVIRHGDTGRLFPCGDSTALADEVVRLIRDQIERDRLGKTAQRYVESRFTVDTVVERTIKCYRSLQPSNHVSRCGDESKLI